MRSNSATYHTCCCAGVRGQHTSRGGITYHVLTQQKVRGFTELLYFLTPHQGKRHCGKPVVVSVTRAVRNCFEAVRDFDQRLLFYCVSKVFGSSSILEYFLKTEQRKKIHYVISWSWTWKFLARWIVDSYIFVSHFFSGMSFLIIFYTQKSSNGFFRPPIS